MTISGVRSITNMIGGVDSVTVRDAFFLLGFQDYNEMMTIPVKMPHKCRRVTLILTECGREMLFLTYLERKMKIKIMDLRQFI